MADYSIKSKKEIPLMSRTEAIVEVKHTGAANPPYTVISKELANLLKADQKLIVVKHVYPKFGEGRSEVIAYVYKDEASMLKFEPKKKEKKTAEAAAAPAPAEAKKGA
jgi:ribosomal protein S24E